MQSITEFAHKFNPDYVIPSRHHEVIQMGNVKLPGLVKVVVQNLEVRGLIWKIQSFFLAVPTFVSPIVPNATLTWSSKGALFQLQFRPCTKQLYKIGAIKRPLLISGQQSSKRPSLVFKQSALPLH